MSFRRDQTRLRRFNDWMGVHRNSLLDIGVPLGVTEDQQRWSYFLEHDNDERSGWSVEALSRHSAQALDSSYLMGLANVAEGRPLVGVWLWMAAGDFWSHHIRTSGDCLPYDRLHVARFPVSWIGAGP